MKIVNTAQMRAAEAECVPRGVSMATLMENAGRAVAEEVRRIVKDHASANVLVLVGPGNNGGDGLVCARYLFGWGTQVAVWISAKRPDDSNLEMVKERSINIISAAEDAGMAQFDAALAGATILIDALFGTGKIRPLEGIITEALLKVSRARKERPSLRIIALDLPSGLDADTGAADEFCLYADHTVTLAFPKTGLFNLPGAERAGRISVVDIGIPDDAVVPATAEFLNPALAVEMLPPRPVVANKGTFGRVMVVAGSINYPGAAYLACSGAVRVGAGLVTLATPRSIQPILAAKLSEVTYLPLGETGAGTVSAPAAKEIISRLGNYQSLLIGCGLGQNRSTSLLVKSLLEGRNQSPATVIDADGLNALTGFPHWRHDFGQEAVLTPHPGEMARLSGMTVAEIQKNRIDITRALASEWRKVIVLKGAYTVIAAPSGRCRVSPFANPGLASAGTGDVLAGVISGLIAQGLGLFEAACLGVYLHGMAADMIRNELGDAGMTASDLLLALPKTIKDLKGN
ncbi:MAG: NAD(P)H-hydrate dehydratase [Dehalococcoidia bacterium]|nr:MAG: NAD(P)H-hydrate dehydratase [Dehalococcoidia bacterium]